MKLQELELKNISQIYKGKNNHCRCGCGGEYVATSFMEHPRSIIDNKKAEKWLKNAKTYDKKHNNAEYSETYINIGMANNQCYTIYLDELKK